MSLKTALEALKRKDFAAVRAVLSSEKPQNYSIQHFQMIGLAELSQQDWQAAYKTFSAAVVKFPAYAAFWLNKGIAEENLGLTDDAILSNEQCLKINDMQVAAQGNLANLYRKKERYADSETMVLRAMANGMARSDGLNILALVQIRQGKIDQAEVTLREAQLLSPRNDMIIINRANILVDKLKFLEAWPLFAAARAINDSPAYRRDEGMARILSGDYERGWPLYEGRLGLPDALRVKPTCPMWKGEPLQGKRLLILAEQGFGDVIQFARYQKFLQGAELAWAVPKPLVRLLAGVVTGKVYMETDPIPACDYYIPIMSLPFATGRMRPEQATNYLTPAAAPKLPEGKHTHKVGLVWRGSYTNGRDHERSIPLDLLAPLLATLDADFYAPVVGDALAEIGALPVTRLDHLITDFADTAALVKQMNCVITVDTAVAHLAGTMGVKTFLLLSYCPDGRWGTSNDRTPWYPSMTLVRQSSRGDWASVVAKLSDLLKRGF
jgi:tetratricopeptide (TPR) repeat protein